MKKLILLATSALVLMGVSSSGQAADLPVKAPPPLPPPFSWTGFYIGGNVGAAWAERRVTDAFTGLDFSRSSNAVFMGGGQLGFNYQINYFVLGFEWDVDAVGSNNDRVGNGILIGGLGPFAVRGSRDRWMSTIAARLGVANDRSLAYIKLGAGEVGVSNFTVNNLTTGVSLASNISRTRTGGMIGFGFEYAFINNFTMKAEYDVIMLSDRSFTVPAGAPFLVGDVFTNRTSNVQMLKVGFNYLFGRGGGF